MEITEVKVYPANEGKLKGYATMVFDGCFIVRDMKIIKSDKGLFVSMPSRRKKDGSFKDIVHPLNSETRKLVEELRSLELRRLKEEYIVQIVDLLPRNLKELKAVFADVKSNLHDDELKKVMETVKKYVK